MNAVACVNVRCAHNRTLCIFSRNHSHTTATLCTIVAYTICLCWFSGGRLHHNETGVRVGIIVVFHRCRPRRVSSASAETISVFVFPQNQQSWLVLGTEMLTLRCFVEQDAEAWITKLAPCAESVVGNFCWPQCDACFSCRISSEITTVFFKLSF